MIKKRVRYGVVLKGLWFCDYCTKASLLKCVTKWGRVIQKLSKFSCRHLWATQMSSHAKPKIHTIIIDIALFLFKSKQIICFLEGWVR